MPASKRRNLFIILILGALTTVSPFSIDMYLSAFPQIAAGLGTSVAKVSLSVSSYFIGLALGQVFYGPLLDRFGRKKPLYVGLGLYILASVGCMQASGIEELMAFRFLQAIGGCAAQVASLAMVRDFFPAKDTSRILSMLILILGVSPLLAPTVGSFVATAIGWQGVFALLAAIVAIILGVTIFFLPEGHVPDKTISLRPKPILRNFWMILRNRQFHTYTISGAFAFSGLFVYVAGAPLIFMGVYHVSAHMFGIIFAGLAVGFIGGSQINIALLKHYSTSAIYRVTLLAQSALVLLFLVGAVNDWYRLPGTIFLMFLTLACVGISNPNASALALNPFSKNAGSASALFGFLELGIAALISMAVGLFEATGALPAVATLAVTTWIALLILFLGKPKHLVMDGATAGHVI